MLTSASCSLISPKELGRTEHNMKEKQRELVPGRRGVRLKLSLGKGRKGFYFFFFIFGILFFPQYLNE